MYRRHSVVAPCASPFGAARATRGTIRAVRYRLLCCADTHGRLPPPLPEEGAAAWLHAGDVTDGPNAVEDESDPSLDPLRADVAGWFKRRTLPVFIVRGNHDTVDEYRAFRSASDATGLLLPVAPQLWVAGVGWHGERYFELPLEADLEKVAESVRRQALRKLGSRDRVVLLTHYPARTPGLYEVLGDAGVWYESVRRLVDDLRPLAVVHGHMHQWAWTSRQLDVAGREVLLLNPGRRGALLTVDVEAGTAAVEWAVPP
jgi:Icc-related predicted phosphoesterase